MSLDEVAAQGTLLAATAALATPRPNVFTPIFKSTSMAVSLPAAQPSETVERAVEEMADVEDIESAKEEMDDEAT